MDKVEIALVLAATIITFALGFSYGWDAGKRREQENRYRALYVRQHVLCSQRFVSREQFELWKAAEVELRRLGA